MATRNQIERVLNNPNTKIMIDWLEKTSTISKSLISPQFFHTTHNELDRKIIVEVLSSMDLINSITRIDEDGVHIEFNDEKGITSYTLGKGGSNYTPPKKKRKKRK